MMIMIIIIMIMGSRNNAKATRVQGASYPGHARDQKGGKGIMKLSCFDLIYYPKEGESCFGLLWDCNRCAV